MDNTDPAGSDDFGRAQEADKPPPEHNRDGLELAQEIANAYRRDPARSNPAKSNPAKTTERRKPTGGAVWNRRKTENDPAPVGHHLHHLIAQQGWEGELAAQRVFSEWADIVGAEVAAHCQIVGHADGQVHVQTDSTAWAAQLRLLAPNIVAKLNQRLGDGTVVRIEVRGPQAPSWKAGGRSVRGGRGPRDTYG